MATRVTTEDILAWLSRHGCQPRINDAGWISLTVTKEVMQNQLHIYQLNYKLNVKLLVMCDLDHDIIVCCAWYPSRVPANKRIEASELITRINWSTAGRSLIMNISTGDAGWASHIFVADADFQANQFNQGLRGAIEAADLWYPAFHELIYVGRSPEEAFNKRVEEINRLFKKDESLQWQKNQEGLVKK